MEFLNRWCQVSGQGESEVSSPGMCQGAQKCALGPFCQMTNPKTNRQPVNLYCLKVSNLFRELVLLLESSWTLPGSSTRRCWVLHPRQLHLCCSLCAGMRLSSNPNRIFVDMRWALWSLSKLPISSDFVPALAFLWKEERRKKQEKHLCFLMTVPRSEFSVPRTSCLFLLGFNLAWHSQSC